MLITVHKILVHSSCILPIGRMHVLTTSNKDFLSIPRVPYQKTPPKLRKLQNKMLFRKQKRLK